MRNIVLTILFLFIISGISWKDKTYGVTSVSVVTSNGISGTVQNATTSAAITISVGSGAITNTQLAGSLTGLGYITGAGGSVTQATNRTTGVTLNKICGAITTNNASLAAGAEVSFVVTNSTVAIGDVVMVAARSGQTAATSIPFVTSVANGSFTITLSNFNATTADTGAMVINFLVLKSVSI